MRADDRAALALERVAAYYEGVLWRSDVTGSVRERLAELGIDEDAARAFGVGWAPDDWHALLGALERDGFTDEELIATGIAQRSARGRLHVHFRSRIMFLIRDADGRALGFAGRATNPGPSWPLWTTAPDGVHFQRSTALFGIDRAREAIGAAQRAVVLDDCLEVLRRHATGEREAVAVIRAQLGPGHLAVIARAMGVEPGQLGHSAGAAANGAGVRAVVVPGGARRGGDADAHERQERFHEGGIVPDPMVVRSTPVKVGVQVARALIGAGMPFAWLGIVGFDRGADASATSFVAAIGGVAVTYMALALAAAVMSGRVRARSRARRMRAPWERGSTEWQPPAWTYHLFEDVMVGAAIVSVFVCTALFFTIGGFVD